LFITFHRCFYSLTFLLFTLPLGNYTSGFIQFSCHCVSPSYISCSLVFLLHLFFVYYIIITIDASCYMIFTSLIIEFSTFNTIPISISHSCSHLSVLACLIFVIFSYRYLFYSLCTIGPMCTLNIRSFTNHLHYTTIVELADRPTRNIDVFALTVIQFPVS